MASNILIVIFVTSLATYLSRFLGVVSSEKIKGNMFKYILAAISILSFIVGLYAFGQVKTSIHEVSGMLMWVISVICFAGYGIIAAIEKQK